MNVPKRAAAIDRRVRHRIYQAFIETARAPTADELAVALELPLDSVARSIDRLAEAHAIALAPGTRNVWMAFPFSAVPTAYPVRTAQRTYWANCAWDALGVPALLGVDAEIRTQCADCGDPLVFGVRDGQVESDAVVHFLVPPKRFWENVGFT